MTLEASARVATCSETCSTTAAMRSEGVVDGLGVHRLQLFTIRGLFRNQQVAGSIPAGGSSYLA